jgi:hypothetical protein
MSDAESCICCGGRAEWLCDFAIGWPIAGHFEDGTPYTGRDEGGTFPLPFTCDAPLCDACRRRVGWIRNKQFSSTVDYCPIHAGMRPCIEPMEPSEAMRKRRDVWAQYRRDTFAVVGGAR